ncbi:hypothetical protein VNI00_016248 [Paramarasmius palmivorus]|uniref:Uncharacterized protein n=1 Tax=Paramarasmius palmivorus TaxID=297713 RepID=A0AAW0BCY9_9AGAR
MAPSGISRGKSTPQTRTQDKTIRTRGTSNPNSSAETTKSSTTRRSYAQVAQKMMRTPSMTNAAEIVHRQLHASGYSAEPTTSNSERFPAFPPASSKTTHIQNSDKQPPRSTDPTPHTESTIIEIQDPGVAQRRQKNELALESVTVKREPGTGYVDLDTGIEVHWRERYRPGYGVDICTCKTTNTSAFQNDLPDIDNSPRKPRRVEIVHSLFVVETGEAFAGGIGLSASLSTTGVTAGHIPMETKAQLLSMTSTSASAKTFIVYCKAIAEYSPEYFPRGDIPWKEETQNQSYDDFRRHYGEYYIAGCKYTSSCEILISCQMHDEIDTKQLQAEARAQLWSILMVDGGYQKMNAHTMKSTTLDYALKKKGCSKLELHPDATESIPAILETLLQSAQGEKEIAYLNHYSTLDSTIPRTIERIHIDLFYQMNKIDKDYNIIQSFLKHPASYRSNAERAGIVKAVEAYEQYKKDPARPPVLDQWGILSRIEADFGALVKLRSDWEAAYELMRDMKTVNLDVRFLPPNGASQECRWECGKSMNEILEAKRDARGIQEVTFRSGQKAWLATWSTTTETQSRLNLQNRKQFMEFRTLERKPQQSVIVHSAYSMHPEASRDSGLLYEWHGEPVYVLGWSLWVEGLLRASRPSMIIVLYFQTILAFSWIPGRLLAGCVMRYLFSSALTLFRISFAVLRRKK